MQTRYVFIGAWLSTIAAVPAMTHCGSAAEGVGDTPVQPGGDACVGECGRGDASRLDVSEVSEAGRDDSSVDAWDGASGDTSADAPADQVHEERSDQDVLDVTTVDTSDGTPQDVGAEASDAANACVSEGDCSGGLSCCSNLCVDVHKDPKNCGQCGNACTTVQFCDGKACTGSVLKNVCANPKATVAYDKYSIDNEAGAMMGDALADRCNPSTVVRKISQDSAMIMDQTSGQPITGPGDTFVVAGGDFGQRAVKYMESNGHSPIYSTEINNTNALFINRSSGATLVSASLSSLTPSHDFFVQEVATDPASGTLVLIGYGLTYSGTTAAAFHFANVVAPNLGTYDKAWYVYEWTDANGNTTADASDTFTLVASGP